MIGINLHNIAADALTITAPYKDMIFTKVFQEWRPGARTPTIRTEEMTVKGKILPANIQDLRELGFNLQEYQYYQIFVSLDVTQLDRIRQLGTDTFVCEGFKYRIVAKEDWLSNAGWREALCYLDEEVSAA